MRNTLLTVIALTGLAYGQLPTDPAVQAGTVQIHSGPGVMNVHQGTDRAIVNWGSFNIGPGELVRFLQPGPGSAILNRVTGGDASQILGALSANGQVFLVNPNGILFGKTSTVNVGSLFATTLGLRDEDFLQGGRYPLFQVPGKDLAAVVNEGSIRVNEHGWVVLVAPTVKQEGLVMGQVAVHEGTSATVSFDPEGLIQFEVPQGTPGTVMMRKEEAEAVACGAFGKPTEAGRIQRCEDGSIKLVEVDSVDELVAFLTSGQPLTREVILEGLALLATLPGGTNILAFNNPFLSNLDVGEPPGGFSSSDLADLPSGAMLIDDQAWMQTLTNMVTVEE